jgi:hypothetical protein
MPCANSFIRRRNSGILEEAHIVFTITVEKILPSKPDQPEKTLRKKIGIQNFILVGVAPRVTPPRESSDSEAYSTDSELGYRMSLSQKQQMQQKWVTSLYECLETIEHKKSTANFHKSKLTMMLRDSIVGKKQSVVIASLSPHLESFRDASTALALSHRLKICSIPEQQRTVTEPKKNNFNNAPILARQIVAAERNLLRSEKPQMHEDRQSLFMSAQEYDIYQQAQTRRTSVDSNSDYNETDQDTSSSTISSIDNHSNSHSGNQFQLQQKPIPVSERNNIQEDILMESSQRALENQVELVTLRQENSSLATKLREIELKMANQIEQQIHIQIRQQEQIEMLQQSQMRVPSPKKKKVKQQQTLQTVTKLVPDISSLRIANTNSIQGISTKATNSKQVPKEKKKLNKSNVALSSEEERARYNEVMEVVIRRLKDDIEVLTLENFQQKKEIQKKEAQLQKYRSQRRNSQHIGEPLPLQKSLKEAENKIEQLQKRVSKARNEQMAANATRRTLEDKILQLSLELSGRKSETKSRQITGNALTISQLEDTKLFHQTLAPETSRNDINIPKHNSHAEAQLSDYEYNPTPSQTSDDDSIEFDESVEVEELEKSEREKKLEQEVDLLRRALARTQNQFESPSHFQRKEHTYNNVFSSVPLYSQTTYNVDPMASSASITVEEDIDEEEELADSIEDDHRYEYAFSGHDNNGIAGYD